MNILRRIWQKIEFSIKVYKYNLALKRMLTAMKEFQKVTKEYEKAQEEFLNYLHKKNFQVEIVNNKQQNKQKPEERSKISYIG